LTEPEIGNQFLTVDSMHEREHSSQPNWPAGTIAEFMNSAIRSPTVAVSETRDPLNQKTAFTYAAAGNMLSLTDARTNTQITRRVESSIRGTGPRTLDSRIEN
jgi:YD repeat-containing protein